MPSLSNPWVLSFGDVKHLSSDLQMLLLQLIEKRSKGARFTNDGYINLLYFSSQTIVKVTIVDQMTNVRHHLPVMDILCCAWSDSLNTRTM